ncbi:hypothetical protein LXL04_024285 [Taraxacum kok-saghyz]
MASSSIFNLSEQGSTDSENEEYVESSTDTDSVGSLPLDIEEDMFVDARFEDDVDASMTKTTLDPFLYLLCPRHKDDAEILKFYRENEYEEEFYDDDSQFGKLNWNVDGDQGVPNSQTQPSVPETQYDADGDLQEVAVRDEEDSDSFWCNIPNDCWNYGNKKD